MSKWLEQISTVILMITLVVVALPLNAQTQGLEVTAGERQLTLKWAPAQDANLSHYELYRSVYNGYIRVDKNLSSFTDTGLDNGVIYYYSLVAVDKDGNKREIAHRTPGTPIDTPPMAPQAFQASGRNGLVRLRWILNHEPDMARYALYRQTGNQTAIQGDPIATLKPGDSTFVDTGLTNATLYTYTLVAIDQGWNQSPPARDIAVPGYVPEGVTALAGDRMVRLKWPANSHPDITAYQLYRTTDRKEIPDGQDLINRIDIQDTTYTDRGLQYGQTYYYYLVMVDNTGHSNLYVDPVNAAPQDLSPQAPGGLQVTTAVHDATLTWQPTAEEDVARIYLYRSLSSETAVEAEVPIAQMDRTENTYTDPGLRAGTTYYYFLVSEDQGGKQSVRSPQVSATIPKPRYKARDLTYFLLATQFFLIPLAIAF